ncbi:MAG: class E sortase [Actinobacteria bacterium]|nr:class E sortase [Actinomycetota bacterium]
MISPPRPGAQLPRAPVQPRPRRRFAWRRPLKVGVALVVALVVVYQVHARLIASVIHDQRQQHLAAQLAKPAPTIGDGDALGIIQIESAQLNAVFVEGVSVDNLRAGPSHLSGSALPGDAGVMVLFGHRTAYGGPFREVAALENGDSIVVQARNGGPIVRYIVDRVERDIGVDDVDLPKPGQIAYLVLVTNESGLLHADQTVVVARALPVTDATAVVPDLAETGDAPAPLGLEAILGAVALVGAALAIWYLRGRFSGVVVAVAAGPAAVFGIVQLLMLLDGMRPLAR